MNKHILFYMLFLLLQIIPVHADELFSSRYAFTYITMENGLLHNYIDNIYKDSQGFIWISTGGGGLSRYDGYEFVHYNTNTSLIKLKSNFIREVCEDDFGRLWIISEGGIDLLSLSSLQQTMPYDSSKQLETLMNKPTVALIKDHKGCIWICCGGSLFRISFDPDGNIRQIHTLSSLPLNLQSLALQDIDEDGAIWTGINHTIYKIHAAENGKLKKAPATPGLDLEAGTFISAFKLKENEVWIGTDRGLYRYNRNTNKSKHYQYQKTNNRSLSQNYITDLAITHDKQLIVNTLMGFNIYHPIPDDFEQVTQQEGIGKAGGLNSNFLNCLLADGDLLWIGTETGGINKLTPRKLSVRNYTHAGENPYSLSPNPVNAIYEDSKGTLWVGTVEGGLNRKVKGSEQFTHYTSDTPPFLSHNSVSALAADGNNQLWVGTWGKGINILNPDHPEHMPVKSLSSQTHPGFPIDFIGSLCYDPINKGMWIGANPGIFFYDLSTPKLYSPFPGKTAETIHGVIGALIDNTGKLWMGSMEGLYIIDLHSQTNKQFSYKHLKYKLDRPGSLLIEKISCFYQSKNGTIWLGSNGYGIYKYIGEKNNEHFISYTTEQGLSNNNVRGIQEDEKGNLWISTNNGLSCFSPASGTFSNYTREDGLLGNQFYWNAHCRSTDGTLYFGELNGLVAIETNQQTATANPAKVALTKLRVSNEEIYPGKKYIDRAISLTHTLRLHESDKSFSLEFSALNYMPQPSAVYRYRLLGFDDQWVEVPASRRFASFTNLPHGKYRFQVTYIPEGERSDTPITELSIEVSPFFYKTPGFILLVVALFLCTTFYLYKRRIRTLQAQKELLHRTVEERTRELAQQNEILTGQNEKITRQKAQLIRMSKKVQELTVDKLSFFTNITHEFRTPITLIIGPIERALKLSYNPQVIEQLHFVERNSKYLLSLVNQLMDFRKIESGKLEINRTKGDFLKFLDSVSQPFVVFAEQRNINIRSYYRINNPELFFDPDAMQKVIGNLLSNAIKFTPDGGVINLYAATLTDPTDKKEKLYLCIKDTGTGIAEEELNKIFNRFYQSAGKNQFPVYGQSGTGIGLYLSKRIIQIQDGTIKARNNRKKGASFCITLPLYRKNDPVAEEQTLQVPVTLTEPVGLAPAHFAPNRLTLLIVEDNKDMRSYIRSILSDQYNILEAENGAEALTILSTCNVDFIISDLIMPVMDGIELSRKVKENFAISHIPFLMLTAKTSQESRIESYRTGVDEYLLKPFNEELLLTRIRNILENRKRYQRQFALKMEVNALNIEEESSDKKFMDKILETIKANYRNPDYEVTDFVEDMGISKSLLNKKMQNLTGQAIGQFIRNYRLNIARELIEKNRVTRNMNISEIAYEVGFNDPKYFTRCFTKRYHTPPSSLMEG